MPPTIDHHDDLLRPAPGGRGRLEILATGLLALALVLLAAGVVMLVAVLAGRGVLRLDLLKEATGANVPDDLPGKASRLTSVLAKLRTWITVVGFLVVPIGAAGAGIAWAVGAQKGPRYVVQVIGAGLLIGLAGVITA